jgi:hypothetical protein
MYCTVIEEKINSADPKEETGKRFMSRSNEQRTRMQA